MAQKCRHELLPIKNVELDQGNPRIARFLEHVENVSAEDVALALSVGSPETASQGGTTFHSLRESIRTNEGIIQPIIVNECPKSKYTVIEGNTRLAIYREFDEEKPGSWSTIPAVIYNDLSIEEIDAIRLQAHLIGPRAWDPYSKAKYLYHLRTQQNFPYSRLVDYCGGRSHEVKQLIEAYLDMEKFYRPVIDEDADFDEKRFSAFRELQNQRIKSGILKSGYSLDEFATWVHDGKIYPTNLIRKLPQVLENPVAKETFFDFGLEEAVKLIDGPNTDNLVDKADLQTLCVALRRKVLSMPLAETQKLRDQQESDLASELKLVRTVLKDACETIFLEEI